MAILTKYCKGKSTVSPSQTVFHNVCSGHTVLFLCLYDADSKKCHEATTHNCDSTGEKHDMFLHKLILALGLLRNISCSFHMCYFGIIRDRHILLMHIVGPIACGVLSGGCSAGSTPCSSRICVM